MFTDVVFQARCALRLGNRAAGGITSAQQSSPDSANMMGRLQAKVCDRPGKPLSENAAKYGYWGPRLAEKPDVKRAASVEKMTSTAANSRTMFVLSAAFMACVLIHYSDELARIAGLANLATQGFNTVHDVHRLLFLAPIIYAAYAFRVRGALAVTIASFVVFLPHTVVSPFPDSFLRASLSAAAFGLLACVFAVTRNESDWRSRSEAATRRERDKLSGVFEGMQDGVMIVGPRYGVRYLNRLMTSEFGEGAGLRCYEYLRGLDKPCAGPCKLLNVIGGKVDKWEYAFENGRAFEVIGSPFVDSDGEVCQLATFRDITERKKVEQELVKLDELKSELLSNVSHELRSPLTSIKGIITSLLQKDIELDKDTQEALLRGVCEESDRLASLVTNLLDMSRLEAGVWRPDKERCYISNIVEEVFERQKWIHRGHIFEMELDPECAEACADYGQIKQVLINLTENAAAYSKQGSRIVIRTMALTAGMEVSVADEGVGIPQEELTKIFQKFSRGTQAREKPGGIGLGLAICLAIVEDHGGRIWAESELGHGSTFHFTLPACSASSDEG